MPDMIVHKKNGFLAYPENPIDLGKGIKWVLNHRNPEKLKKSARDIAEKKYGKKFISDQYKNLYKEIILRKSKN